MALSAEVPPFSSLAKSVTAEAMAPALAGSVERMSEGNLIFAIVVIARRARGSYDPAATETELTEQVAPQPSSAGPNDAAEHTSSTMAAKADGITAIGGKTSSTTSDAARGINAMTLRTSGKSCDPTLPRFRTF